MDSEKEKWALDILMYSNEIYRKVEFKIFEQILLAKALLSLTHHLTKTTVTSRLINSHF